MRRLNEDLLYDICNVLENAGDNLRREPSKTMVFRLLQERIGELSRGSEDTDLILLDFFLKSIVQRLWFNLMIDFPYEVGEEPSRVRIEIVDDLFKKIGKALEELAGSLRTKDHQECYQIYRDLAHNYVRKLRELEAVRR